MEFCMALIGLFLKDILGISTMNNFYYFLNEEGVKLKDFKDYALKNNSLIKRAY